MKDNQVILLLVLYSILGACAPVKPDHAEEIKGFPKIFPADFGATIPFNIAPLNFRVDEPCEQLFLSFSGKNSSFEKGFHGNKTQLPVDAWAQFLSENQGDSIYTTLYLKKEAGWFKFKPFSYFVSNDPIDNYLLYRLIMPGYQTWNKMGIYQRSLSGFEEDIILNSRIMPHTCMNCHALASNNPENMLMHLRENHAGTILIQKGQIRKLETKTPTTFSSVSFPYWHPSARYIAFSINKVRQLFPSIGEERAHAFDQESDMVIYDVEQNEFLTSPQIFSKEAYEAFPCFSPDGETLFFITAKAVPMPQNIKEIRYSLCSVPFDVDSGKLGTKVDTLISASKIGKSVTLPRVSPDGKFIMITSTDHGNFSAYDKVADLWLFNLQDSSLVNLDVLNTDQVESYHSWSSNSRWVVFSSRRMDGLYMNAYFAHIDEQGKAGKPFLLPQEDADFHKSFLYSFNIPEFSIKAIDVNPYDIEKTAKQSKGTQVKFENTH